MSRAFLSYSTDDQEFVSEVGPVLGSVSAAAR